jgi:hypothetical protein
MIEPFYYSAYNYSTTNFIHNNETKLNINTETKKENNDSDTEINNDLVKDNDKIYMDPPKNDVQVSINMNMIQFILNPLTVIVKLSILSCKPIGTKIHIQNNIIYLQEPGIFQALTRYIFKSNKSHLQYLYNPIKIACQTYLTKEFIQNTPKIIDIFTSAKKGIDHLIQTYDVCPITVLCLKYYHVIISNYIKQISSENIFKEDDTTDFYTDELITKLKEQWNTSKLKIILELIDFLLNHDMSENIINNIKSLETIIQTMDENTNKIITEYYKIVI